MNRRTVFVFVAAVSVMAVANSALAAHNCLAKCSQTACSTDCNETDLRSAVSIINACGGDPHFDVQRRLWMHQHGADQYHGRLHRRPGEERGLPHWQQHRCRRPGSRDLQLQRHRPLCLRSGAITAAGAVHAEGKWQHGEEFHHEVLPRGDPYPHRQQPPHRRRDQRIHLRRRADDRQHRRHGTGASRATP